jgi:hypothetical protein
MHSKKLYFLIATLAVAACVAFSGAAKADWDHHHHHYWRNGVWIDYPGYYYAPPAYYYYAPRPVYYYPPQPYGGYYYPEPAPAYFMGVPVYGLGLGLNVHIH